LPSADKEEGGSSDADVRTFWCKKLHIWIFMVSPQGQGVEPVRTFCKQGRGGQFFTILCGRPFWMAPNKLQSRRNVLSTLTNK